MVLRNIFFVILLFSSIFSCVSNSVQEDFSDQENTTDTEQILKEEVQVIEYFQPVKEPVNYNIELILPEIIKPVSITVENIRNLEELNINSIMHKPEIILSEEPAEEKQTEEEIVRDYLSQYGSRQNNYSQVPETDTLMRLETESAAIENSSSKEYINTPVDYFEETVSSDQHDQDNEIIAKIGDPIIINLEKDGWLFLGTDNNQQLTGLKLVNSEQSGGYSNFTFNALELGYYQLKFLRQDNVRGTQETDTIYVNVLTEKEFDNQLTGTVENFAEADFTYAENLMQAGQYQNAVLEFLKNYRENNSYLNDRIAEAYSKMGNNSLAMQYWLKNINSNAQFSEKAVIGVINAAIAADDYATLIKYAGRLGNISNISLEEVLINLTEYYKNKADYKLAIDTYNLFMARYPFSRMLHRMYFIMGELYEANSSYRDFEKSVIFYEMIYNNFPESTYAREAEERVDYINRHFFYIR